VENGKRNPYMGVQLDPVGEKRGTEKRFRLNKKEKEERGGS